jgi:hypothetical protein
MRARQRHFTLGNSGALACWDARPLTQSDGTAVTTWTDRIASLAASRAISAPVVKVGIQGGQPVLRFGSGTSSLDTGSNSFTQNKGYFTFVSVASVVTANSINYQQIVRSRAGATNNRCVLYLRQSKVEAGGRRLDANSYQFVQSNGTFSNNQFVIASGEWRFADAELTASLNATGTNRSGGFQTSGNTSNTASILEIGATGVTEQRLIGDVGLVACFDEFNISRRRRFEHSAAFSFKIACN